MDEDPLSRTLLSRLVNLLSIRRRQNPVAVKQIDMEIQEIKEDVGDFYQSQITEIATPRTQIIALEEDLLLVDAIAELKEGGHSCYPVQQGKLDNIVGFVFVKDILGCIDALHTLKIKDIMRKPYFIPADQKIYYALEFFRDNKISVAVILDEYGGVDGIVSLRDFFEELFGEFSDAFDPDEDAPLRMDEDGAMLDGEFPLDEFNDTFGTTFSREGIETIGGFICDKMGKIAEQGEVFEVGAHRFEIVESTPRQVLKVKYFSPDKTTPQ